MTASSRERFAAALRAPEPDLGLACLLIGAEVEPDLDIDHWRGELDRLAALARPDVPVGGSAHDIARGLRTALADAAGFRGYAADYGDVRASLLHEVLRRRRGLPITLAVVYLEVAKRIGLRLYGIGIPGHFVVGVPEGGDLVLLDPFHGGRVTTMPELGTRVGELAGSPVVLGPEHLRPWSAAEIVTRVLANIRNQSSRQSTLRMRLWALELALLVPAHSPALRRERGELLVRLGDFLGGARELEAYAGHVALLDPEEADLALREARMARARLC